mmetsp:Transcript_9721/g.16896  ORF Transcript_9721/g.16896 Transcript_9721/m.16896 type:complete len:148 (-) Transcript_9721:236-679(-)|eukprot:CAMPEP_0196658354 /NCGR_PEP_ID=MMETSP1086-20130531/29318_1 /TAXON_ID=77921 /ORGANISM="Cyanoptyche  gloeocystis , Strain SAG4.97" /LENGTH=147 /DNA_ID=CAMNT_0041991899 /DNA_START=31 /DNA_END=474 /DNA_ORIENTATION=-
MATEEETAEVTLPEKTERKIVISVIANPLAGKKLTKRLLKLVKKSAKKKVVRRGVKEVVKAIRKKEKGLCIIAGDISPIDVITHLPVLCEESDIPYIYVPSKEDLGTAGATKRPTSCILIPSTKVDEEIKESYDECITEVKALAPVF